MEAKDKAMQLVCKMYGCEIDTDLNDIYTINGDGYFIAKDSALIAVNEILNITCLKQLNYKEYFNSNSEFINYWQEVKEEINKL